MCERLGLATIQNLDYAAIQRPNLRAEDKCLVHSKFIGVRFTCIMPSEEPEAM